MNTNKIEVFYTLICPNCKTLKIMLNEILPDFGNKFELKRTLANSPMGFIRTTKLGIHSVPTLLINDQIVFKGVPSKQELINKLKIY
ncbi:MAG: thioredoxin family protein [Bacteroidales bacterium]|nr:thioredoxin family protein [Bacteroidales bacterium]